MSTDESPTSPPETEIVKEVGHRVQAELPLLAEHSRIWFEAHRTHPREINASSDPDGIHTVRVWLVTDDIGHEDGSSRVVYDTVLKSFGLLMQLQDGVSWYMGPSSEGVP
jgi:hypothetical protein